MRNLLTHGLVLFAGMVSIPVALSPSQPKPASPADYRNDPRYVRLTGFFAARECPAGAFVHVFLEAADDYELDWRLLPSLSVIESSGGKQARNNNIFGWDSGRAGFTSMAAGIHAVGYRLAHSNLYKDKDLDGLLFTYNPDLDYVRRVKSVMRQIAPRE